MSDKGVQSGRGSERMKPSNQMHGDGRERERERERETERDRERSYKKVERHENIHFQAGCDRETVGTGWQIGHKKREYMN